MLINPIQPNSISFKGYNSILKTLYKKGDLPEVKYGFYGDLLTKDNCSVEHLKCRAKGGKTVIENLVLTSKRTNNLRGDRPLKLFLDLQAMATYLEQFIGIKRKGFDGDAYIKAIIKTVGKEL